MGWRWWCHPRVPKKWAFVKPLDTVAMITTQKGHGLDQMTVGGTGLRLLYHVCSTLGFPKPFHTRTACGGTVGPGPSKHVLILIITLWTKVRWLTFLVCICILFINTAFTFNSLQTYQRLNETDMAYRQTRINVDWSHSATHLGIHSQPTLWNARCSTYCCWATNTTTTQSPEALIWLICLIPVQQMEGYGVCVCVSVRLCDWFI